ncbi:energy transducer TonB [Terriglobus tenax]|uniref:energy transducer TonB n=1 Tax=Terriglobus tenax TaxID=1111115 RepID=UPI0021E0998B|nr:energy transducer TonB [Terriglobus tenax]
MADPDFSTQLQKSEMGVFRSLLSSLHDLLFPEKLPPLELVSSPVPVADPMAVKRDARPTGVAVGLHIAGILFVFWVLKTNIAPAFPKAVLRNPMDTSDVLPPAVLRALGSVGGGGGHVGQIPVTQGALPKSAEQQIVPPENHPPLSDPKISIQPTVEVQNLKMANTNMPNFGMPNAPVVGVSSLGNGRGPGIGTGNGPGVGPGENGNIGGHLRHVGNSVLAPVVIYDPAPEFSEEARRNKFQGQVTVVLVVDAQGHPQRVRVPRPVGMGLDEKAMEAVNRYRFKPATENGIPVAVEIAVVVDFEIF